LRLASQRRLLGMTFRKPYLGTEPRATNADFIPPRHD
jgi:hypothetical protein